MHRGGYSSALCDGAVGKPERRRSTKRAAGQKAKEQDQHGNRVPFQVGHASWSACGLPTASACVHVVNPSTPTDVLHSPVLAAPS